MARGTQSVDFPPVEGFDGFLGQGLPTANEFKEALMIAGGAAGAVLLGAFVLPKVLPETLSPPLRAAIALGIAVVGGIFAFRLSPQLGVGIIGGLGGFAVASIVGGLTDIPVSLGYLAQDAEDAEDAEDAVDAAAALEQLPEEQELLGLPPSVEVRTVPAYELGETVVQTVQPGGVLGEVPIGTWL